MVKYIAPGKAVNICAGLSDRLTPGQVHNALLAPLPSGIAGPAGGRQHARKLARAQQQALVAAHLHVLAEDGGGYLLGDLTILLELGLSAKIRVAPQETISAGNWQRIEQLARQAAGLKPRI